MRFGEFTCNQYSHMGKGDMFILLPNVILIMGTIITHHQTLVYSGMFRSSNEIISIICVLMEIELQIPISIYIF